MTIFCRKGKLFKVTRLLVLVVILIGQFFITGNAAAIEYGGIGGRPAYPREDNPRTESIFIHTMNPGEIIEDGVLLVNNSSETKTLLVYAVDSVVSSGGAFACRQKTEPQESVGAWVLLGESEVTLDSGTNKTVPFTLATPQNVSAGEHNGCIIIQEKKESTGENTSGMSLSFRTGLRVAITVPGELTRKLEIVNFQIEKNNGRVLYKPAVRNTGNVSVDAVVRVEVNQMLHLENFEYGGQYPILRNEVSDWNFEMKKVFWGGLYRASLTVEYAEGNNVEIGKINEGASVFLKGPTVWYFVPPTLWAFLLELAILGVIIFAIIYCIALKRRSNWIKNNWVTYTIKASDDIKGLAAKFDVSWKLLAKANKIVAPYTLKTGEKIIVPPQK